MEIAIDHRGEGTDALKFSLSVRSLDGRTHSELTKADRAKLTALLVAMLPAVELVIKTTSSDAE